ncbi:MAG: hypothetical protein QOG71_2336 [Pyrinomonadaceae bacterium]|nr:hypothetical protein [Pyrinomonadaceae bacterium]
MIAGSSIKSTRRGWLVSVKLPDEVRHLTGKRVHSAIVRGSFKEASHVCGRIEAKYYPPRKPLPYFRKCGSCLREFATRDDFKDHYANLSLTCANCRDQCTKDKQSSRRSIGLRFRFRILKRDSFTCQYCGRAAPKVELHVDHVIPVSKGGSYEPTNLVTACVECNLGKHDSM